MLTLSSTTIAGAVAPITSTADRAGDASRSWRDVLKIHPAAEMFPLMSESELRDLTEDIKKNGQCHFVAVTGKAERPTLVDGRNRLDAMELAGIRVVSDNPGGGCPLLVGVTWLDKETDPYEYVVSANIHRRHLSAEQRIEVAEKLAKADPAMSARRIAKLANISPTTAVKAKTKVQETGDVSTVDTSISIDTKGRKQPAKKRGTAKKVTAATNIVSTAKTAPADETAVMTPPADEQAPVKTVADVAPAAIAAPTARADVIKSREHAADLVTRAFGFLDLLIDAATKHPHWINADQLGERLQTKASAFIELAQRGTVKQGGGK